MRNENKEVGACKQELMAVGVERVSPSVQWKYTSPFFTEPRIAELNF